MQETLILFFDVAAVSVALSGCVIACYFDLAKGRVPNKLTGLMLFTSLILAASRIMTGETQFLPKYVAAICFGISRPGPEETQRCSGRFPHCFRYILTA
jgi:Flp pilus assembly protein protease CpaA